MTRFRTAVPGLLAAALLALAPAATRAQDDALDKLLQKLDDQAKPPADDAQAGQGTDAKPAPGEVTPGDEGLDNLLKRLGESPTDQPTPEEKPPGPKMPKPPGDQPRPPGGGDAGQKPDALEGGDKALDRVLEEMVRPKKPDDQDQQSSDGSSPLAEAIKKMEEARKRLSQNDTGEQTRKTQGDVVKELDQILERLRQARSQSQSQQRTRRVQQAGQKGQQPGQQQEQPGNTAQGTGPQMPKKPNVSDVVAGNKDTWGDLPPHLRDEMENVFREEMLPAKRDLIIRYYSSVARKGRNGGD